MNNAALEKKIQSLQKEIASLRSSNDELNQRLDAYSSVHTGQTSLINQLIDKVPFGVILINEEYRIFRANEAAEDILSMPFSQLKGMNGKDFFSTLDFERNDINERKITKLENGKYVMHSAFISDEGSHKFIIKSLIDISEIKFAEQELVRLNEAKDEFISMISHEFRSPLNIIQGYSSLLEDEVKNLESTDAVSYLQHITHSGEMLLHMVSSLLEISNLAAGKITVDLIPVDLEMLVLQLKSQLEKEFLIENNKLIFEYKNIPLFEQDLILLMKVLYELLNNANKFTEAGEVTVSIELQKKNGKDWVCFKVSDTGCGLTEEEIKQIFYAFHQTDSSMARTYDGLGLGLSLVEKIVKTIKGQIEVTSEIGIGSTFVVWVPYYPASVS